MKKLMSDPVVINHKISPLDVQLFFMDDTLRNDDSSSEVLVDMEAQKYIYTLIPKDLWYLTKYAKIMKRPASKNAWVNPYSLFLSEDSYKTGLEFVKKHKSLLDKTEKKYDVPYEYFTAILFVETRFGKITGDYHVFSVYNSLYHFDEEKFYDRMITLNPILNKLPSQNNYNTTFWTDPLFMAFIQPLNFTSIVINSQNNKTLPGTSESTDNSQKNDNITENKNEIKNKALPNYQTLKVKFDKLLQHRINWAYTELRSLLIMAHKFKLDIHTLHGSWAGAFGLCQFIPSSYIRLARDGNKDKIIDLYNLDDALASTAHYLKKSGLTPNNRNTIRHAIYLYNHSTEYVDIVEKYALTLKKRERELETKEE